MRISFSLGSSLALAGALALGACSSSNGNPVDSGVDTTAPMDTSTAINVSIAGIAAPHPITTLVGMNPLTDFAQLLVAVVDPMVVIATPTAPPLAGGALDTSPANCTSGCAWGFPSVDISKIQLGLVGIVDDARTADKLWVKTGTGAGSAAFITMEKASMAPITGIRLFAVSKATEAGLATFAGTYGPDSTVAPGVLESRGFMLATVVDKLSVGAGPVAGAMITTSDTRTHIIYPNAAFNGLSTTGTAAHGTVLVVPKSATPTSIVATWTITPPTGDTHVWPSFTAGTSPGTAFALLFPANE
ncbi:MAG TPA: hypothetical protein VFH68_15130 [Polyangia bacterium]|nr:hypothetical protein [Polyangia bacterium]